MSTENSAGFPKECVAGRGKGKLRELPGKALDDMEIDLELAALMHVQLMIPATEPLLRHSHAKVSNRVQTAKGGEDMSEGEETQKEAMKKGKAT